MTKQILFESKKKVKLNDLSDLLKIKKSTIKNWEKEFNLPSLSAESASKLYSEQEVRLLKLIKTLLYEEKCSYQDIQEKIAQFLKTEAEKTFNPAQSLEECDTIKDETPALAASLTHETLEAAPLIEPSAIAPLSPVETEKEREYKIYQEDLENIKRRLLALQEKLK